MITDANKRDSFQILIFPFLLTRMLHNQIWISISRYMTAKGKNRIVDKSIEFEQAILEAEAKGVKVFSLGLLNQGEELNRSGELFIRKNPQLKVKLVDGSSLAVAVVLNSIPKGSTQVVFKGNFHKVASYLALALCQRGIQVAIAKEKDYQKLKSKLESPDDHDKLVLSWAYSQKIQFL